VRQPGTALRAQRLLCALQAQSTAFRQQPVVKSVQDAHGWIAPQFAAKKLRRRGACLVSVEFLAIM
jgi:hypothetical protein